MPYCLPSRVTSATNSWFEPFKRIWSKIEVVATPAWPPEQVQIGALQDYVLELRGDWR